LCAYLDSDMRRLGHGDEPKDEGAGKESDDGEEDADPDEAAAREPFLLLSLNAFLLLQDGPRSPGPVAAPALLVGVARTPPSARHTAIARLRQHAPRSRLHAGVGAEGYRLRGSLLEVLVQWAR
jgi:hypothetical protein